MRIGLSGFGQHPWQSVERTRQFYSKALSDVFELQLTSPAGDEPHNSHVDALLNFSGSYCWELAEHPDHPLIFAMHGGAVLNQEYLRLYLGRLKTSDVLIVNCSSDVAILRDLFVGETPQLCHLPLPVNSEHFRPLGRRECRAQLPIPEFDYIIGFVGRLLPQKNPHQFLRFLADLKRRLHPATIGGLIVGSYWIDYPVLNYVTADYPHWISGLLTELDLTYNVAYLPAELSDQELARCYGAMDLLVHPTNSIDENFGYAPLEAMACGTPVLGAAYGGLKDTILHGETGYLMPTWVTQSGIRMDLIQGLDDAVSLLSDHARWAQMSEAAVRRVREKYSFPACAEILRSALSRAILEHQAGHLGPLAAQVPRAPETASWLPPLENGWERFQNVAAYYVSSRPPVPGPRSRLRLAAPLAHDPDGSQRLLDPAWPAKFHLDKSDLAVVDRCKRDITVAELERIERTDWAQLRRLIHMGLLLCTG